MTEFAAFSKFRANSFEFCESDNGVKDAMDFVLVAELGWEAKGSGNEFIVVSSDKGYDSAIKHLKNKYKVNVRRETCFDVIAVPAPSIANQPKALSRAEKKALRARQRAYIAKVCNVNNAVAELLRAQLLGDSSVSTAASNNTNTLNKTISWLAQSKAQPLANVSRSNIQSAITKHYNDIMAIQ